MEHLLEKYNEMNNFGRLLNMTYTVLSPGKVDYNMTITSDLLATYSAAHGGAIAAYMDAIIGVAALSATAKDDKVVSTVEFKINYLKPALLNQNLIGIGEVISQGKRILIVDGKIYNEDKELVAIATGTLNAYPAAKLKS